LHFTAEEVQEWLDAGCFEPAAAAELRAISITPDQAAQATQDGVGDHEHTIGYRVSNCDLRATDAVALVN